MTWFYLLLNTIFLFRRLGIFPAGVDNILVPFQVRRAAQANFARSRRSATLSSHTSSAAELISMLRALYNSALSSAPRSSLRGPGLFLTGFPSQVIPYGLKRYLLALFISYLHARKLTSSTIKSYLSAKTRKGLCDPMGSLAHSYQLFGFQRTLFSAMFLLAC